MGLDPNLKVLLANTVSWEQYSAQDGHGDETYSDPDDVPCRIEAGVDAIRDANGTEFVPRHILYVDASDDRAQAFTHRDRFTVNGIGDDKPLQPKTINPIYGPGGDVWLIEVTLA